MGVGAGLYMCDVVKKVHVRYLISWWVPVADVIAFCCKLQRCKLLVVSFIVVVIGVLVEIRKSVQLGVCAGLYMYDVVVKMFTFAMSSHLLMRFLYFQVATHVNPQVEWTIPAVAPIRKASPHFGRYSFSASLRVEGWVGLSGWSWCSETRNLTFVVTSRKINQVK